MMKKTNFGPLLLLLLLAVTPRNSSANLIASHDGMMDGAPANMSSPTANDMIEGVELLTQTFTWLQGNMLSSNFDEAIDNFEKNIIKLPSDLAVNRIQILELLYGSQDQFTHTRSVLNGAADSLKAYCINLIDMIDSHDVSERLLKYIANKVVINLGFVNGILNKTSNILIQINNEFSVLKPFVKDFNDTLNSRADEIIQMNENEKEMLRIIKIDLELLKKQDIVDKLNERKETLEEIALGECIITLGVLCPLKYNQIPNLNKENEAVAKWLNLKIKIDLQNKLRRNIERQNKLQGKIGEAQKSTSALLSQVFTIKEYIETASDMITKLQGNLKESILDHEDISNEVIESKLKALKYRLIVLKNACTSFRNH